jgi:hypothetical protein
MNFKITTRDDYEIAKFIVKKLDDGYLWLELDKGLIYIA